VAYKEYKKFKTVGEWWEKEGHGKFPLQIAVAITRLQKEKKLTFHQAFEFLVNKNAILFTD
jgi:hypothetical protein